jgi:AraC-like DNA-binding protein
MSDNRGMLEMVFRAPHPALRPHVAGGYWGYVESGPPVRRVEVVQTGIVVHIALGPALEVDGQQRASFVAGLYDAPVVLDHAGEQRGIQVNLTPLGARILLARPLGDLARSTVALDDVLGRVTRDVAERIAGLPDWSSRLEVLDSWLLRRLRDAPDPRPDVAYAWSRLARTGGRVPVGTLCAELGCSRRHLAGRFADELGLGPKTVARMLRFERADAAVRAGQPLAAVAAACGYADQAHLTRDFRAFAGRPPAAHRRAVTNDQDRVTLAL